MQVLWQHADRTLGEIDHKTREDETSLFRDRLKEGYLMVSVALVLLASLAALVLYVPLVSLIFGMAILFGTVLMFVLGFYLGVNQDPWRR